MAVQEASAAARERRITVLEKRHDALAVDVATLRAEIKRKASGSMAAVRPEQQSHADTPAPQLIDAKKALYTLLVISGIVAGLVSGLVQGIAALAQ